MACLHPLWVVNPKYRKFAKNGVLSIKSTPYFEYTDVVGANDFMLSVPCGRCAQCRKRIANEWKVRLYHEYQNCVYEGKKMYFVTFTLDEVHIHSAKKDHYLYIRKFLEAYRYRAKESARHFIVTELGKKNGRLHYHGIIFNPKLSADDILSLWQWCSDECKYVGYVIENTMTYITKYLMKPCDWEFDEEVRSWYSPRRYVSRGLGRCYCEDELNLQEHNRGEFGKWYCVVNGVRLPVPRYYKDKLFTKGTIYAYKWYMLHNPPDEWRIGSNIYTDFNLYLHARDKEYKDSLKYRTSYPEKFCKLSVESSDQFDVFNPFACSFEVFTNVEQLKLF